MPAPIPQSESVIDPSAILQGHNEREQRFSFKRSTTVVAPNGTHCDEYLCSDQFGNWYLIYRATLSDNETYDVGDWVKPSMLEKFGGFTDGLFEVFRGKAYKSFNTSSNSIALLRHQASESFSALPDQPVHV